MPRKSSIAIFIAATSALAISSPVSGGEKDLGGLKEWNTDMSIDAEFLLDEDAQKIADEAAKSSTCIPVGEGENCWWFKKKNKENLCVIYWKIEIYLIFIAISKRFLGNIFSIYYSKKTFLLNQDY